MEQLDTYFGKKKKMDQKNRSIKKKFQKVVLGSPGYVDSGMYQVFAKTSPLITGKAREVFTFSLRKYPQ